MAKRSATRTGGLIIVGLLILGLVGFGATNFGGSVRLAGSVGDTEISVEDYGRALQSSLRAQSQQLGRNVTMSEALAAGLDRAVLGQVLAEAAIDDEARRLGISAGDQTVAEQIRETPAFQGVGGSFDRDAYAFVLERNNLTVEEYETDVRNGIARRLVALAATAGATMPPAYTDTLYRWARESRDITWAILGAEDLAEPLGEPSEDDLQAWYEAQSDLFTLAEEKSVTYAWLTPDMIIDDIALDEDAVRALYESRLAEYVQPERRLVERLVYGSQEAADAARARLDAGEADFDDLVADRGLTLDDVDLGEVSEADLGSAGAEVFALEEPGVVGPLQSPLGPAFFRMNGILMAQEIPFEEVRDELEAELAADRARRAILDRMGEIDDLLASGATLEELANETEMQLGTIGWRPDVEDDIAAYAEFREAAAAAQPGDFPEVLEFREGGLFALRVDEVLPPRLRPLNEVRPDVIAGWERDEIAAQALSQALGVADQIRGGREMAGLDLKLRMNRGLMRDDFLDAAPPGMIANVFKMSPGDIQVFEAEGGAVLVRLDAVTPPNPDDVEGQVLTRAFGLQASQATENDLLEYYTRAVENRAGIRINQQAINAVHAQFP